MLNENIFFSFDIFSFDSNIDEIICFSSLSSLSSNRINVTLTIPSRTFQIRYFNDQLSFISSLFSMDFFFTLKQIWSKIKLNRNENLISSIRWNNQNMSTMSRSENENLLFNQINTKKILREHCRNPIHRFVWRSFVSL